MKEKKIETDQDIIQLYQNKVVHNWNSIPQEHKNYLDNRYTDSKSYKESVWRILYDIEVRPKCKVCGGEVKFIGRKDNIFSKTCSKECNKKIHTIERHYTPEEIYYQSLTSLQKTKYTCIKKYGVDHMSKLPSNVFVSNNPQKKQETKDKIKATRIDKYGQYMSPNNIGSLLTNDCKEKRKESFKKTMIERYGDVTYRNLEKHRKTCLEKYGVDCWQKTKEFKEMLSEQHDSIQRKRYETQKMNNSFNSSQQENESFVLLKSIFPDVIYQYKDKERYPFICDFYIPSLDLFIECNYHWTHGGKLFEGTIEDITKLQKWKEKNTKYYDNAISTWTIRDTKKHEYALKNNLNYVLFYTIEELKYWIEHNK